uniref:Uncharacterized protein n=1 Tax=Panagrolaimus sp. JU765 TaxID=591449 RepID=A0AC34Q2P7_9BILA
MWRFLAFYVTVLQLCGINGTSTNQTATTTSIPVTTTPYMEFGFPVNLSSTNSDYQTFCGHDHPAYCTTSITLDAENRTVARALRLSPAIFLCPLMNSTGFESKGIISWFLFDTTQPIGYYDFNTMTAHTYEIHQGVYEVYNDSGLLILESTRMVVDRYLCFQTDNLEQIKDLNSSAADFVSPENLVLFRLDYSQWYSHVIFDSVFYGSILSSMLLGGSVFILNIIWIVVQKIGLTIIRRREKRKGAQSFLQAMELYRQTQIKSLQDAYHNKLRIVSEHYHRQVEQVREAYISQVTRIKDYGQTQYDSYVAAHVDNVREGYNAQLSRLREFGSRHADQLFEGYERQLNRLRAFTLAQRMRLMRQYQLRQKDVNELLERISDNNLGDVSRQNPLNLVEADLPLPEPRARIKRSISSFSLPEFMLVDGGQGEQVLRQVTPMRRLTNQSNTVTRLDVPGNNEFEMTTPKPGTSKSFQNGSAVEEMPCSPTEKSPLLQTSVKFETARSASNISSSLEAEKRV